MNLTSAQAISSGKWVSGTALVQVMIGLVLSTMLLAMTGSLWLFGSRSLAAMGNYAETDARGRNALAPMSRVIRPATPMTASQNSGTSQWLRVTNATVGATITCPWKAAPQTLVCQEASQRD